MHKARDGKTPTMLPSRSSVPGARTLGRVISRSPPVLAHHISCEEARLLLALRLAARALALGARARTRGRLASARARERAAVRARHLLLHLHGHLVLRGLGRHLRGLLLDGHFALGLRHRELRLLLLVRLLNRELLLHASA